MNALTNPLAIMALNEVLQAVRRGPASRYQGNSSLADKSAVRGGSGLFEDMTAIGQYEGHSPNAEIVSVFLVSLMGHQRSRAMLNALKWRLGDEMSLRVVAEIPDFN